MKNYILFSAVGGHDPIANYHDGAVLHICRTYRPQKVYLYLSKEMIRRNDADNRYEDSLVRLQNLLDYKIDKIQLIKREDLTEVQLFDTFYQEFESEIEKIIKENPGCTILLNLSSGTPAMKSAMEIISTLSTEDIVAVQVSTPTKKENEKKERPEDYDNDCYWETNDDNKPDYVNRCREIVSVNLTAKIKKEIIIEHLKNYDYHASSELAKEIDKYISPQATDMIKAALLRSRLDIEGCKKLTKPLGVDFLPVKNAEILPAFEYILMLDIKRRQRQYADFIRAISPVIQDVFAIYLKKVCGIDYKNDCCKQRSKGVYYPDFEKMEKSRTGLKVKQCLLNVYGNDRQETERHFYSSAQMLYLIKEFSDDKNIVAAAEILRDVEQNIRNIAAHEIISVDERTIKNKTGVDSLWVVNYLKKMLEQSMRHMKTEFWNSYNDMNDMIIKAVLE